MDSLQFAVSTNPGSVTDCYFYHSTDLPTSGPVDGSWDLRGKLDEYLGGVDFSGKRVLDVGCASGFLTFEMEKRGAVEIVSLDASSVRQINFLPVKGFWDAYEGWVAGPQAGDLLRRMKNSYWLTHRENDSKARAWYGDIYNIPSNLGMFDIVVLGQILVHLRDPVKALWETANRCADTLIIAEGMVPADEPMMKFLSSAESGASAIWWHLSTGLYKVLLTMMGFEIKSLNTALYRCNDADADVAITTIVAKRRSSKDIAD
jgi:SAM-dependent methyltransferase